MKFKTKVKQLLPLPFLRLSRNMNVYSNKGDEQEKSRDRNYKSTRRFQGRIVGNQVMF